MANLAHPSVPVSEHHRPLPPPNRRRDKPQLSCTLCRRRKLKCDRNHPCSSCSNRGLSNSCTYVPLSTNCARKTDQKKRSPQPGSSIQDRINQLEGLVLTLMNSEHQKPPPATSGASGNSNSLDAELSDSFGRISLENDETRYVSGDHWISILEGIAELKDHFDDGSSGSSPFPPTRAGENENRGPKLLFGCNDMTTRESILDALPQRPVTDRLVSKYFNFMDMTSSIIHGPSFLKEYEKFWLAPSGAPIMWIGLLFAVIALGTHFQQREMHSIQSSPRDNSMLEAYKDKVVECLVLGKYTKVGPYTIEALMLYFSLEHLPAADTRVDNWILVGTIVRLAMRAGYHRDPSHTPQIKPFHAEMRRRHWATIMQLDLMTSTQVGLPRMVSEAVCDTAEPRNLLDNDFDDDVLELPPSRPDTDMTPILYLNVRNKLLRVFGMITDFTASTHPTSYADVMRLEQMLHETVAAIPVCLQPKPLYQLLTESSETILRRIYLDMVFQKARCILHRKYLTAARSDVKYIHSRTSCIEAAVQILQYQDIIFRECQPGGLLYRGNWKFTSVLNHDFLLASTILSLDLNCDIETSKLVESTMEQQKRERIIRSLKRSYNIWIQSARTSQEARKAAEVLQIVLVKAQKSQMSSQNGRYDMHGEEAADFNESELSISPLSPQPPLTYDPGNSMYMNLDWNSTFNNSSPLELFGDFTGMAASGATFDQDNWDSLFRGPNAADISSTEPRPATIADPTNVSGPDSCY